MANLRSSKKDIRRIAKKRAHNQSIKTALKTYVKKVRLAIESGDLEKAREALHLAAKYLDKAAEHGIIHKNQSARRKSRIANLLNKAQTKRS